MRPTVYRCYDYSCFILIHLYQMKTKTVACGVNFTKYHHQEKIGRVAGYLIFCKSVSPSILNMKSP